MYQGRLKIFFSFLLFAYYILHTTYYAYAEGISLAINPPLITIQTEAPALIEQTIRLENKSNSTVNLNIELLPFSQKPKESGIPNYAIDTNSFFAKDPNIFKKVQIFDGDNLIKGITLSPKQQKNLVLKINIPENENNADYYFSILFISKDIDTNQEPTSSRSAKAITTIRPGIATNILLSIFTGKKQPEGIIEAYSTPLVATKGPISFNLTFTNTGSHLLIPQGTILITNMFGQTVGKISVPPTHVLAKTNRDITLSWNEKIILGPYNATLYLKLADNKDVSSPEGDLRFKRSISFFGLPYTALGSIIGVIILIALLQNRLKKYIR